MILDGEEPFYDFNSLAINRLNCAKRAVDNEFNESAGETFSNLNVIEVAECGVFGLFDYMGGQIKSFNQKDLLKLISDNNARETILNNSISRALFSKIIQDDYYWSYKDLHERI